MAFQSAAVIVVAAADIWLPTDAGAQAVTYTYTYDGVAIPIFRDVADIISIGYVYVRRAVRITKVTANIEILV